MKEMTARRKPIILVFLMASLVLGGCAGLFLKAPSVTLADIKIIDVGLLEQRFAFKLRIQNPNDREIAVTGLSFVVEINEKPFAKGVSNKPVTIPRLEEQILEVTAVSSLFGILGQVKEFLSGEKKTLTYRVKGRLLTDSFGDLDFDESGKLELPTPDALKPEQTRHRTGTDTAAGKSAPLVYSIRLLPRPIPVAFSPGYLRSLQPFPREFGLPV
jgi:LEA14-like dessication related protein